MKKEHEKEREILQRCGHNTALFAANVKPNRIWMLPTAAGVITNRIHVAYLPTDDQIVDQADPWHGTQFAGSEKDVEPLTVREQSADTRSA